MRLHGLFYHPGPNGGGPKQSYSRGKGQIPSQPLAAFFEADGGGTICIVYDFVRYKDGQKIKDKFVRGGVYEYKDANGTVRYAPIFIQAKQFKNLWPVAAQLDVNSVEESTQPQVYI